MRVIFCHHISLDYGGGGEKWLVQLANELVGRGHEVEVRSLPFKISGSTGVPLDLSNNIEHKEALFHNIEGDIVYMTYHPFNTFNFRTKSPKIAGIHSHCYWLPVSKEYGILPNLANITNHLTNWRCLNGFDAIHTVTDAYPINHNNVHYIPNFVDSTLYHPNAPKNKEFTVGFASRKVWQKGYDLFLQLKSLVTEANFVETNRIPEYKMPEYFSEKHVTLVPSRAGTVDLVNIESNLCGTPVISSGILPHRRLGLPLRYARTPQQYISQIKYFMDLFESEFYDMYAKECRKQALRFDKKTVIDQLEKLFIEVSKCSRS